MPEPQFLRRGVFPLAMSLILCFAAYAQNIPTGSAFETLAGLKVIPWNIDSKNRLATALTYFPSDAGYVFDLGSENSDKVTITGGPLISPVTVCITKDSIAPGLTNIDGNTIYITDDWLFSRNMVQLAYVFVHEAGHCGFIQGVQGTDFWEWATDLEACDSLPPYQDRQCKEDKANAMACSHAQGAADASSSACAAVPPPCPDGEPCPEEMTEEEKKKHCATAGHQRELCESLMGLPHPPVEIPDDPGFDSVPAGPDPGSCQAGLDAAPPGVSTPMITCPPPCPACNL